MQRFNGPFMYLHYALVSSDIFRNLALGAMAHALWQGQKHHAMALLAIAAAIATGEVLMRDARHNALMEMCKKRIEQSLDKDGWDE